MRRIFPSFSACRPKGGDAQPTSIWPVMTCVSVTEPAPVATGFVAVAKCLRSASGAIGGDARAVERDAVFPPVSANDLIGEPAGTYQYKSPTPVVPAARILTGA